jgi:hypothetical protein
MSAKRGYSRPTRTKITKISRSISVYDPISTCYIVTNQVAATISIKVTYPNGGIVMATPSSALILPKPSVTTSNPLSTLTVST